MFVNETFLQELKSKIIIEDIVSNYVSLKKRGSNAIGICPFHNEKTPSFTVYNDTQSFYCYGCATGGDAITFVQKIENIDFIDAVRLLTQYVGVNMPDDVADDNNWGQKKRRILEINRESAKFFHDYMMTSPKKTGLNYWHNRNITQNTINYFSLGYAPNAWNSLLKHLKEKGFGISEMIEAGVVRKGKNNNYYDTFRNRVIIPILDVKGNIVAFSGRTIDNSSSKYINSTETIVYKKSNELFALNLAKKSNEKSLILCEGYMDVITMYQAGITNAVSTCGTTLTQEQIKLINRYAEEVIIAYDTDNAGQKAIDKAIDLFKQTDIKIKIPKLIGGKDPDEIIHSLGIDEFTTMLNEASNDIEYKLYKLKNNCNLNSANGKIQYINEAINVLKTATPVEQDLYLTELSKELNIDKRTLKLQLQYITPVSH